MNNVLCIFPKDCTTEFLNPVYEEIISIYTAKGLLGDPTEDDEYLEKLSYEASRADSISSIIRSRSSAANSPLSSLERSVAANET